MKKCKICQIEKPYTEFNKNQYAPDGHLSKCRACVKQYYKDLQNGIRMSPEERLNQIRLSKRKGMETEKEYAFEILSEIGYDIKGELSVHQQFMLKHNLI
jgi:Fe-S-cluster-containing dehydrogenase component